MMIKEALSQLVRRSDAGARLMTVRALRANGYLKDKGWIDSVIGSMPVDAAGEPIPWYTYASIDFLSGRVGRTMTVFEYGSGNSTLWWARRVAQVVSCEHDRGWHDTMKPKLPANVSYAHVPLDVDGAYAHAATRGGASFDVIVVDGRDRVHCTRAALPALKPDGVVVFDNSDRDDYADGYAHLRDHGFRRVDFWGMGPINAYGWCTSVFYRADNCFGL